MRYKFLLLLGFLFSLAYLGLGAQEPSIESTFYIDGRGKGTVLVSYTVPSGLHQIDNRDYFTFSLDGESGFDMGEIIYPPTRSYGDFQGYEGTIVLQAELKSRERDLSPDTLSLTASYQLCDEKGTCFRPGSQTVTSMPGDVSLITRETGDSLLLFLLFAFLGGAILNIMPCVLPVLSLKALHLVNQSGDSRRKILINSLLYTGGILFSMLILALIVISIKASGTALGWGFQFQNPLFVLILSSLVFLFSLSLFEVFFINPPGQAGNAASKSREGYAGSFFTGIMAVLLATPCTAPLLGSALGFAFVRPGGVIILFFLLIGLGLALPFILLGIFPSFIKRLPKLGEWMNRFREFMGFLLAGTAIYLLSVLHGQLGGNFPGVLWFFLFLAMGAWLFGRGQRQNRRLRVPLYLAALLLVGFGLCSLR